MFDWWSDWVSIMATLIANLFRQLLGNFQALFLGNINAVVNGNLNRNLFWDILASLLGYLSADNLGNFPYNVNTVLIGKFGNLVASANCNLLRNLNGNFCADWNIGWPAFGSSITGVGSRVAVLSLGGVVTIPVVVTLTVSSISLWLVKDLQKKNIKLFFQLYMLQGIAEIRHFRKCLEFPQLPRHLQKKNN